MVICLYLSIMASYLFFTTDGAVKWIAYAAHIIFFTIACYSWHKMKSRVDEAEKAIGTLAGATKIALEKLGFRPTTKDEKNGGADNA